MVKEDINEKSGMSTKDRIDALMSLANFYQYAKRASAANGASRLAFG
jgi:hypothetical protein